MPSRFLAGPRGDLEVLSVGNGDPATVFAHGLGSSIASTRPYGSGLSGRRTFFHFASHGRSAPAEQGWTYDVLADELLTVACEVEASRAVGVSMGAGAILHTLAYRPHRFERAVLIIPASIDSPRQSEGLARCRLLADASAHGDVARIRDVLAQELPANASGTEAGEAWLDQQSHAFAAPGMCAALRDLPHAAPIVDRAVLQRIEVPVLILGQRGDDVHQVEVARELAQLLPNATYEEFDDRGLLFAHRDRVREQLVGFISDPC